ncbi:MAG: molybdenum cofactor carrier protein [Calditrichaeota bacterium]|nr:MAG: molybdenum cofactor carrier protein [Calditrichota bacterium]
MQVTEYDFLSDKRPVIGVMGSGKTSHEALSLPLGRWIARQGYHLLTGGGQGVMRTVAKGFVSVRERAGLSIGIIPGQLTGRIWHLPDGYPNPFVELPIYTHLPDSGEKGCAITSRNAINILSSTLIIGLPGGAGTQSEIELAIQYQKPHFLLGDHKATFKGKLPIFKNLFDLTRELESQVSLEY